MKSKAVKSIEVRGNKNHSWTGADARSEPLLKLIARDHGELQCSY